MGARSPKARLVLGDDGKPQLRILLTAMELKDVGDLEGKDNAEAYSAVEKATGVLGDKPYSRLHSQALRLRGEAPHTPTG
jgi:hypothetical protein